MKAFILILTLFVFLLLISFSFGASGIVTISLNITKVWWNDTVNATGRATYSNGTVISGDVSISLDSTSYSCSPTGAITGNWECVFNAPTELGTYTVLVTVTNGTGSTFTNSTSLTVAPNYGTKPIGTVDRVVFEIPMIIQDLDGKVRQAWARVMVWKG